MMKILIVIYIINHLAQKVKIHMRSYIWNVPNFACYYCLRCCCTIITTKTSTIIKAYIIINQKMLGADALSSFKHIRLLRQPRKRHELRNHDWTRRYLTIPLQRYNWQRIFLIPRPIAGPRHTIYCTVIFRDQNACIYSASCDSILLGNGRRQPNLTSWTSVHLMIRLFV